jgi:hypothetical protein
VENPLENPGIKVPRKSQIVRYVTDGYDHRRVVISPKVTVSYG